MKTQLTFQTTKALGLLLILSTINYPLSTSYAQGTAFTYQGRLNADGQPANGSYDLRFALFDAASSGNQAGSPITNSATAVSNGLFTVALDFGAGVFTGADRWLDIAVRPGASAVEFTNVVPRQKLTATPYAVYAGSVSASGIVGPIADSQLSGNVARLSGSQTFTGAVNFSNGSNNFFGNFSGNGAGVTNVSASSLVLSRTNRFLVGWPGSGYGQDNFPAGLNDVLAAAGGGRHILALRSNGTVMAWGTNDTGQLNVPAGLNNVTVVAAGLYHSLALQSNGTVTAWGDNSSGQTNVPAGLNNAVALASGDYHSLAVRSDGTVVAWGLNDSYQTDVPPGLNSVTAVAAGSRFSLALKSNGTVAAWGNDFGGITNFSPILSNVVAIAAGLYHGLALKSDGTVVAWGHNFLGETNVPPGLTNVVAVAGCGYDSVALKSDGTIVAWGLFGQAKVPVGLHDVIALAPGPTTFFMVAIRKAPDSPVAWLNKDNTFNGNLEVNGLGLFNGNIQIGGIASGNGSGLTNLNAATLGGLSTSNFWKTGGNGGTTAGINYLGTTDNQALELRVNGLRALRLEPNTNGAPNVIGGAANNFVAPGIVGATIAGGGAANYYGSAYSNKVTGVFATIGGGGANISSSDYATVAGGTFNTASLLGATVGGGSKNTGSGDFATVGGGNGNTSSDVTATVAGGYQNTSSGYSATVGGGYINTSSGYSATVGGGFINTSRGDYATVGGGFGNSATNFATVVPGGLDNLAGGFSSFAAGRQAKALHDGSFVWADSQLADFASTAPNQFLLRASGGVGIGTANPLAQLAVDGNTRMDAKIGAYSEGLVLNCPPDMSSPGGGYGGIVFHNANRGVALGGGTVKWGVQYNYTPELGIAGGGIGFVQNNAATRLFLASNGYVGIGTTSPTNKLHVAGGVSATSFVSTSDRNAKENFTAISPKEVLAKVAALPITEWNFKEMPGLRHMGPMAQDFYAAFGLGGSDTTITTVDPDGVALAAIQGLNQKLTEELKRRDAENAEMNQRLEKLEQLMNHKNGGSK